VRLELYGGCRKVFGNGMAEYFFVGLLSIRLAITLSPEVNTPPSPDTRGLIAQLESH